MEIIPDTPGQKVVLIDDRWGDSIKHLYTQFPVLGQTYVVRDVRLGVDAVALQDKSKLVGEISITLIGITNPKSKSRPHLERGFRASRFKLLDELQQENRVASKQAVEVQT